MRGKEQDFSDSEKWIRKAVEGISTGPALDVGTGGGACLSALRSKGFFAIGMDVSLSSLRGKRSVVQADAQYLPFKDRVFKAVVFGMSLHHIDNHRRCVEEAVRALSEGGELSAVDWSETPPFHRGWDMPDAECIRRIVVRAGLGEVKCTRESVVFLLWGRRIG
ncbi:MAG: class I SAM-dependent methyltransferase [Candidatus Latescibacterota bacterium]